MMTPLEHDEQKRGFALAPRPSIFEQAVIQVKNATAERKPGEKVTANRNMTLCSEVNKFRHKAVHRGTSG